MSLYYGYEDKTKNDIDDLKNEVDERLSLSGGKMKGDINMSLWRIKNVPAPIYDYDAISKTVLEQTYYSKCVKISDYRANLSETLFWEYHTKNASSIYRFDRGSNNSELVYNSTTRKVSRTIDQSLQENDAVQNAPNFQCTKSEKVSNRYFLMFNGAQGMVSDINLNAVSGEDDIINIFIVYRIKAYDANNYWTRNGLFGHDNHGYDNFVSFSPNGDLVVSGATNNFIIIGSNPIQTKQPIAPYKTKANAGETNKWICLSIHWDNYTTPAAGASKVYCNGQNLTDFQSRSSVGSTKITVCNISTSGIAPFKGDIAFFSLYKGKLMNEKDILLDHYVLCNWYSIDTVDFEI